MIVICPECGKKHRFSKDILAVVPCEDCGAPIGVSQKTARPSKTKAGTKKSSKSAPGIRLVDADRQITIVKGRQGARLMLLALAFNVGGFFLQLYNLTMLGLGRATEPLLGWLPALLSLSAMGLLVWVTLLWRPVALRIERGTVINIALVLGPSLLLVAIADLFGFSPALLTWFAFYLGWVYFILLVLFLERVAIFLNRGDLKELADTVLSMGVGVVFFGFIGDIALAVPFTRLLVIVYIFSRVTFLCALYWLVNYIRLLVYLSSDS